jgi:ABC-type polysaccharide/polyol phosphate export permease
MLRDLWAHRDLLRLLVVREIRVRYARAALGIGWALFLPVVMMAVFTVLNFSRMFPEGSPYAALPYTVFAYTGLLFWTHFSSSLTQGTPALVAARDILRKSTFPREVVPLAKVLAALFDLAVGALFLLGLLLWHGIPVGPTALAVPVLFALQLSFTVGIVLALSAANLFYRDVNYLVQVGVVLLMFATAVVYPLEPSNPWVRTLLHASPLTGCLQGYREALLLGQWPSMGSVVPALVGAVLSPLLGGLFFRAVSPRFAEEV